MIVEPCDIVALVGATTMVAGGFDPIHEGHISYYRAAAEFGLPVICSVDGDQYVERKHRTILNQRQRTEVIDALRHITYTFSNSGTTADALRLIRPKIFVKGIDWLGQIPQEEIDICRDLSIEIRFVDTNRNSSSELLRRFQPAEEAVLVAFERYVMNQTMPDSKGYDHEYFQGAWRTNDRYDLETRRLIEGLHPQVIRDVFSPSSVIDMGCGPGYLMHLLYELGIEADGLDVSSSTRSMASRQVRDRIRIGSIVENDIPSESYDLVICREVLEHLPVIDVNRAVQNMCRISSRYVYVTTRFHPNPNTLLDVTTEFHVDPTHITLMNKNLLRLMFVLSGFRRREDLENKMDWMKKLRVLVYERAGGRFKDQ